MGAASPTAAAFAERQALKQVKVGFAYVQSRDNPEVVRSLRPQEIVR